MNKLSETTHKQISSNIMNQIQCDWKNSITNHKKNRCAYYFSAEFLVGRAIYNNILALGLTEKVEKELNKNNSSLTDLETVGDSALGNGGLGRLAACFLESAATLNVPLYGYGLRYRYGLFKQTIEDGFQKEYEDDWDSENDPWSVRKEQEKIVVDFEDFSVNAIPYDMPIIGYNTDNIGTLRLWQSEGINENGKGSDITNTLYPDDSDDEGKKLRFRQEYFLSSASLKDIISNFKSNHKDLSSLPEYVSIQLNDTHPVVSIPELIRLLTKYEKFNFEQALNIAKEVFNYTNHTIMQEALEKWDLTLVKSLVPEIAEIVSQINFKLIEELKSKNINEQQIKRMSIIQNNQIHMAYLAVYCSKNVNGVAKIHTNILQTSTLNDWYKLYQDKFLNVTNGITQRRWLALCNKELSSLITELLGSNNWVKNLSLLKELEKYKDDEKILKRFIKIKNLKKQQLAKYIKTNENKDINYNTIYDVQIKRIHEYKRQFLNILSILELYFQIKEGTLTDFYPTTFIFAGKSAAGYARAKGIIKLINEVANFIEKDDTVNKLIKVVFLQNYNVSYAEKIIPAADVSEQISTAGTEASGTGNMKLMLNGAVTLGTFDGANIEIVQHAGDNNNYIFGAKVEEINLIKDDYSPNKIYNENPSVKRVLDSLIDGTLSDDGSGIFKELYDSILKGASWHKADQYYLLNDFNDYIKRKIELNYDYRNELNFAKKCWVNICNAGDFTSDRAITDYANNVWKLDFKKEN